MLVRFTIKHIGVVNETKKEKKKIDIHILRKILHLKFGYIVMI